MRGTPLIAPLCQPGTKQRWMALWRSALFSSTRLRSKNLMSGCTCRPFIPVCAGSGSGMQNPLANFIGVFSLVRVVRGFQVNPLCRHNITRSDRQIGNMYISYYRATSNSIKIISKYNALGVVTFYKLIDQLFQCLLSHGLSQCTRSSDSLLKDYTFYFKCLI